VAPSRVRRALVCMVGAQANARLAGAAVLTPMRLGPGWQQFEHEGTGVPYYHNAVRTRATAGIWLFGALTCLVQQTTGETTWDAGRATE
jgi:hypothetical protein